MFAAERVYIYTRFRELRELRQHGLCGGIHHTETVMFPMFADMRISANSANSANIPQHADEYNKAF